MAMGLDEVRSQLSELARDLSLQFPISTKEDFLGQMRLAGDAVKFNGISYDIYFATNLIPAFFFPVDDLNDLVQKCTELIKSRGIISMVSDVSSGN